MHHSLTSSCTQHLRLYHLSHSCTTGCTRSFVPRPLTRPVSVEQACALNATQAFNSTRQVVFLFVCDLRFVFHDGTAVLIIKATHSQAFEEHQALQKGRVWFTTLLGSPKNQYTTLATCTVKVVSPKFGMRRNC